MTRPQSSPAALDAVRHLARLGVGGWVLIALLVGAAFLADRLLGGGDGPPPAEPPVVADRGPNGGDGSLPADFGPAPGADEARGANAPALANESRDERRTYAVVTVAFRTPGGEGTVDLKPDAVLTRADGKGLVLADALRGGERLKTNCADAATVASAKPARTADVRPPPRCAPVVVEPVVEDAAVKNFGRVVSRGEVDLTATLVRIARGESFPHRNDGGAFGNREGRLPRRPRGYYREFVHPTPGVNGPGPQRLVLGAGGDLWYTADHYDSFRPLVQP